MVGLPISNLPTREQNDSTVSKSLHVNSEVERLFLFTPSLSPYIENEWTTWLSNTLQSMNNSGTDGFNVISSI